MMHRQSPRGPNRKLSTKGLALTLGILAMVLSMLQACQPISQVIRSQNTPPPTVFLRASSSTPTFTRTPILTSSPTPTFTHTPSPTPTFTLTPTDTPSPTPTETPTPEPTNTLEAQGLVFAVIGDYGCGFVDEGQVVDVINSWDPEFVITVGDNNYPEGFAEMIDDHIGQYFHQYIYPYKGNYGAGADINRFFPSLGNHDLLTDNGQPYLDYFELPGNERYYDFVWGPVHLFALDNLPTEPDGATADSVQGRWLQQALADSTSPWNIVYMHQPPYSSSLHGSTDSAQWPYKEWGADAVLAGHDHVYERLHVDGLTYFVNGMGGFTLYNWYDIKDGSQVRYNSDYGAIRVEATSYSINFQFINRARVVVDDVTLHK